MVLCSLAWLLGQAVHPIGQGDVSQDFLPVFWRLCEPFKSHTNDVSVERKGESKAGICVHLVQDGFSSFSRWKRPSVTYMPVDWQGQKWLTSCPLR